MNIAFFSSGVGGRLKAAKRKVESLLHADPEPHWKAQVHECEEIEHQWKTEVYPNLKHQWKTEVYPNLKKEPAWWREALLLRNIKDEIGYYLILLSPTPIDHQEFEQCIRYIIDSGSSVAANILRQPESWFPKWAPSPIDKDRRCLMARVLRQIRDVHLSDRPAGPRGTVAECAAVVPGRAKFVDQLVQKFRVATDELRKEIALSLGELGGRSEVEVLRASLLDRTNTDDLKFKLSLISALANIGGPLAVETLLQVAESGLETVGAAAISGLEFLSSGGSIALTEVPEPPKIDSPELRAAYEKLATRLYQLSRSSAADEYIRYKASQLLQIIKPSLHVHPADVA